MPGEIAEIFLESRLFYREDPHKSIEVSIIREKKLASSIGVFDGLHKGHKKIISKLIEEAGKLEAESLVITFDRNPKIERKKSESFPLMTNEERREGLFSLFVDYVLELKFSQELKNLSGKSFLDLLFSSFFIKELLEGEDFSLGSKVDSLNSFQIKELYPNKIIIVDDLFIADKKLSSTMIRERLAKNKTLSCDEIKKFF